MPFFTISVVLILCRYSIKIVQILLNGEVIFKVFFKFGQREFINFHNQNEYSVSIKSLYSSILAFPLIAPSVIIYPINYLRNVARRGAGTQLQIVADVENIFCPNFTSLVRNETEKLMRSNEKYVLVYRRFEIENGMRKPQNIRELWTLLRARK